MDIVLLFPGQGSQKPGMGKDLADAFTEARSVFEQADAMAAILGDLRSPIEGVCEQASREAGLVVPANYNAPGQIVISGEVAGVERAMALAKEAGAKRAMRLNVSGAFHSPLMQSAESGLTEILAVTPMLDPRFPVYANVDG